MFESVVGGEVSGMCRINSMADGRTGQLLSSVRVQAQGIQVGHVRD